MKKIKVKHAGFSDTAWYNKFVGQDFEFITEDADNYWVKTGDKIGSIERCDGEIIEETEIGNLVPEAVIQEKEIHTHSLLAGLLVQQKLEAEKLAKSSKIMDTSSHNRIGTFCEKCGMPFCICKVETHKEKPTKQTEGKLFYELDFDFLTEMAKRMQANKSGKYERFGWKKGLPLEEVKQAGLRHYLEVMKGNYKDGDEEYGHIVATALNCMLMLHELKREK